MLIQNLLNKNPQKMGKTFLKSNKNDVKCILVESESLTIDQSTLHSGSFRKNMAHFSSKFQELKKRQKGLKWPKKATKG